MTLIERSFWETLADPHPDGPDKVWGVAYRIESKHVEEVKEYLDIREINGYTIVSESQPQLSPPLLRLPREDRFCCRQLRAFRTCLGYI